MLEQETITEQFFVTNRDFHSNHGLNRIAKSKG
jgi:hypothetical protein